MDWNFKTLADFFQRIETNFPVQQWTMDDIHIWPLVRTCIGANFYSGMEEDVGGSCNVAGNCSRSGKLNDYFDLIYSNFYAEMKLWWLDRRHQQKMMPCDVVMAGKSVSRNVLLPSGEVMEHNLDPLYGVFHTAGYQVFLFERIGADGPRIPRWSNSFAINNMMLMARIKRKLHRTRLVKLKIDKDLYRKIMQEYSDFDHRLKKVPLDDIIYTFQIMLILAKDFEEKLKQLAPRLVILECWYSADMMALCLAAHRLGIPVVDIQHGAIEITHFAYSAWGNMPPCGYEVMPNYIWVWGQEEFELIASWGEEKVVPVFGGKPMDLVWNNPDSRLSQYYYDKFDKNFDRGRPIILFTLQWNTGYPDWIIDFINQSSEYTWLIRLHPFVDDGERAFLRNLQHRDNIIWESVESFPLSILLQKVALHITMHSGVVIEGEDAGCVSIVLDPMACEMYAVQIQRGVARYAKDREALSLAIRDIILNRGIRTASDTRRKEFYAKGQFGIRKLIEIMETQPPFHAPHAKMDGILV